MNTALLARMLRLFFCFALIFSGGQSLATPLGTTQSKLPYVDEISMVSWHVINRKDCVWTQYETPSQDQLACDGQPVVRFVTEYPVLKFLLIEAPIAVVPITDDLKSQMAQGKFDQVVNLLLSGQYDLQGSEGSSDISLVGGVSDIEASALLQRASKIAKQLGKALGIGKRQADEIVEGMIQKGKDLVGDQHIKRMKNPKPQKKPKPGQPKQGPDSPTYGRDGKPKVRVDPGHLDPKHPPGDPRRNPHTHVKGDDTYLITIECNGANLEMVTRIRKKKRPGGKKKGGDDGGTIDDSHDVINREVIGSCDNPPVQQMDMQQLSLDPSALE